MTEAKLKRIYAETATEWYLKGATTVCDILAKSLADMPTAFACGQYRPEHGTQAEYTALLDKLQEAKRALKTLVRGAEQPRPAPFIPVEGICPRDDSPCECAGNGKRCCGEGEPYTKPYDVGAL